MNELTLYENYPLGELEVGETSVIIPDGTSKLLVPRSFTVTNLGEVYRIVEDEYSKPHNISADVVKRLSESGLDDEEICEMFITIHESLNDDSYFKRTNTMEKLVLSILEKENPISFLRNIKYFDKEEIVSIFMSDNPYVVYKELTTTYDMEIDDDSEEGIEAYDIF